MEKMIEGFFRLVCCKRSPPLQAPSAEEDPLGKRDSDASFEGSPSVQIPTTQTPEDSAKTSEVGPLQAAAEQAGSSFSSVPSSQWSERQKASSLLSKEGNELSTAGSFQVAPQLSGRTGSTTDQSSSSFSSRLQVPPKSGGPLMSLADFVNGNTVVEKDGSYAGSSRDTPKQRSSGRPGFEAKDAAAAKIQSVFRKKRNTRDMLETSVSKTVSLVSNSSERRRKDRSVAKEKSIVSMVGIQDGDEQDSDAEAVLALDQLADALEGKAWKFPKSGNSYGSPHLRYVVVEPSGAKGRRAQRQRGTDYHQELRNWRRGRLAYWPTQKNYEHGEAPSGALGLMQIAKVDHKGVNVGIRHKESGNTGELVLQFESEEAAKSFRDNLHKLRSQLQKSVMLL